jgi:PAS domain S-box-containing protein
MSTASPTILVLQADNKVERVMQLAILVMGSLCLALGALVGMGWWLHVPLLVQIQTEWAPMQANTAGGFALLGSGLLIRKYRALLMAALAALAIGTLSQYVIGSNFGIDTLLVSDPFIQVKTSHPGRMSPTTATAFSLLALAGLLSTRRWAGQLALWMIGIAWSLSALALLGYLAHIEIAYSFGTNLFTRMACHTATGMLLGSTGMFFVAWLSEPNPRLRLSMRPVVCAALGVMTIGFSLASFSQHAQDQAARLLLYKQNSAKILDLQLATRTKAIERLSQRSFTGAYSDDQAWKADAHTYMSDFPDLVGIKWHRTSGGTVSELADHDPAVLKILERYRPLDVKTWAIVERPSELPWVAMGIDNGQQSLIAVFDPGRIYSTEHDSVQVVAVGSDESKGADDRLHVVSHGLSWTLGLTLPKDNSMALGWPLLAFGLLSTLMLWWVLGNLTKMSVMARRELDKNIMLDHALSAGVQLRKAMQNALGGMARLDANDHFIEVNKVYAEMFGVTPDDLIGRAWRPTMHPEDLPIVEAAIERMRNMGRADTVVRSLRSNGTTFTSQIVLVACDDPTAGHYCFAQDITAIVEARARIAELSEQHQLAMINADVGVWDWNMVSGKMHFSDTWLAQIGLKPGALLGQFDEWVNLVHPEDVSATQEALRRHVAGKESIFSAVFRLRHHELNRWVWVRSTGRVIAHAGEQQPQRMIGVHVVITELVEVQQQLLAAKNEADRSAAAKSDFLSTMSHEIRTPMNGVIGMANLLARTQLSPQQREFAEIIRSSGEALLTLLNDILDFSKIEAGKMTIEKIPFAPGRLMHEVAAIFAQPTELKGIGLEVDVDDLPLAVIGDPNRLR